MPLMTLFDLCCSSRDSSLRTQTKNEAAVQKGRVNNLLMGAKARATPSKDDVAAGLGSGAMTSMTTLQATGKQMKKGLMTTRKGVVKPFKAIHEQMKQITQLEEESSSEEEVEQFGSAPAFLGDENEADSDKFIVESTEKLASRLAGEASKHPKSGSNFLTRSQVRYFAVLPADDAVQKGMQDRWGCKLQQWRRGRLAWFKDRMAYYRRDMPKGSLALADIKKVFYDDDQPTNITVRHVGALGVKTDLLIKFSGEDVAKEWQRALAQILRLLRKGELDA